MMIPSELSYTKSHEWIRVEENVATVGITDFAQSQLGDLTYVELPAVGDRFEVGEEAVVIESVKAASDLYAPVSGTVVEINEALNEQPELVNSDPYADGWILRISVDEPGEVEQLLSADEYQDLVTSED